MSEKSSLSANARIAYIEKKNLSVLCKKSKSFADIVAKNQKGEEVYYEIKATAMTRREFSEIKQHKTKYFGAATLTEWNVARLSSKTLDLQRSFLFQSLYDKNSKFMPIKKV